MATTTSSSSTNSGGGASSWTSVPPPVRRLFDRFPLRTYAAEPLPLRAPAADSARPRLYVFARGDRVVDRPSFNPSCLKWQAFLRIAGVDVQVVPSNNHASPSGSLPFLIPAASSPGAKPLTGDKIHQFARDHASAKLPAASSSPRLDAYRALLAQNIRPAWLHALYLNDANLPLLTALYLPPSPLLSGPALRAVRAAATAEILDATRCPLVSSPRLRDDLLAALAALSTLLGEDDDDDDGGDGWFFGADAPGLFDAEVFAYTHLMLEAELGWGDDELGGCVRRYGNLVRHRDRLYARCWSS